MNVSPQDAANAAATVFVKVCELRLPPLLKEAEQFNSHQNPHPNAARCNLDYAKREAYEEAKKVSDAWLRDFLRTMKR